METGFCRNSGFFVDRASEEANVYLLKLSVSARQQRTFCSYFAEKKSQVGQCQEVLKCKIFHIQKSAQFFSSNFFIHENKVA